MNTSGINAGDIGMFTYQGSYGIGFEIEGSLKEGDTVLIPVVVSSTEGGAQSFGGMGGGMPGGMGGMRSGGMTGGMGGMRPGGMTGGMSGMRSGGMTGGYRQGGMR